MAPMLIFILSMGQLLSSASSFCPGPSPNDVVVSISALCIFGFVTLLVTIIMIYLCFQLYKNKRAIVHQKDIELLKEIYNIVRKTEGTQTENSQITEICESKPPRTESRELEIRKTEICEPNTPKTEICEPKPPKTEIYEPETSITETYEPKSYKTEIYKPEMPKTEINEPKTPKTEIYELKTTKTEIDEPRISNNEICEPNMQQTHNAQENKTPITIKKHLFPNMPVIQKQQMDKLVEEVLKRKAKGPGPLRKLAIAKQKSSERKSVNLNERSGNKDNIINDSNYFFSKNIELETARKDETKSEKNIDEKVNFLSSQKDCNRVDDSIKYTVANYTEDILTSPDAKCDNVCDTVPKPAVNCNEVNDNVQKSVVNDETYDTPPEPKQSKVKCEGVYNTVPKLAVNCDEIYDILPNKSIKCFDRDVIEKSDEDLIFPNSVSNNDCNTLSEDEPGNSNLYKENNTITRGSKVENTKGITNEDIDHTINLGDKIREE